MPVEEILRVAVSAGRMDSSDRDRVLALNGGRGKTLGRWPSELAMQALPKEGKEDSDRWRDGPAGKKEGSSAEFIRTALSLPVNIYTSRANTIWRD